MNFRLPSGTARSVSCERREQIEMPTTVKKSRSLFPAATAVHPFFKVPNWTVLNLIFTRCAVTLLFALLVLVSTGELFAQSTATTSMRFEPAEGIPGGVDVVIGESTFARYMPTFAGTPIIYPLYGPGGHAMTRSFPIEEAGEFEKADHDHHRSLWFTHGEVNGHDFWVDDPGSGKIQQTLGKGSMDPNGGVVIHTENDWLTSEGKKLLSDIREMRFSETPDPANPNQKIRIVDYDILLQATEGDVNFGDTKEGSFGLRVAGSMKVDSKKGGKITNAEGLNDKQAWAKRSNWVHYGGPVDGDTVGITIFYHPSSFNAPCHWHVRTYGLFAANPFGHHHFEGGDKTEGVTLKSGKKMNIHCRVVLSEGELDFDATSAAFEAYAKEERPKLAAQTH